MALIVPALLLMLCGIVVYAVIQTWVDRWRRRRRHPRLAPPTLCPTCGSPDQTVGTYFMWDGASDPVTGNPYGDFYYATCNSCGSRMAQRDGRAPYVPSPEEWQSALALSGRSDAAVNDTLAVKRSAS